MGPQKAEKKQKMKQKMAPSFEQRGSMQNKKIFISHTSNLVLYLDYTKNQKPKHHQSNSILKIECKTKQKDIKR